MTAYRPGFLYLLVVVPALLLMWRRWPPPLSPGRSRVALALHVVVVVALVMAMADVHMTKRPDRRAIIAVVDVSDSVVSTQPAAASAVKAMIDAKGPDDLFGVVTFGRDAQVEMPPTANPVFSGLQTRPDPTYSDLGGALALAANLIPGGYSRQVVLVSDGRQNLGDAAETVGELRRRKVRVDVVGLGQERRGETLVLALEAPHELRSGETLSVTARLRATDAATGRLSLQLDGREVSARDIELPAGVSEQVFDLGVVEPGTHELGVILDASPDSYSQNDTAGAVVRVSGRPKVLVLEGDPAAGDNMGAALAAAGMEVETRRVQDAPTDLAVLSRYDSIVVADAQIEAFPAGAVEALQTAVHDLGRGLVTTGGTRSYGPGGWENTPLEAMLPVRMQPRERKEKPSVAVVVAVETMENFWADGVALGAVEAVLDQMGPDDELGVVNISHRFLVTESTVRQDTSHFIVPLSRISDKDTVRTTIRESSLGDPPTYSPSLALATDSLSRSTAAVKHVIIIGDGDALGFVDPVGTPFPNYGALFADARADGITVSSVGVNVHSEPHFMDHMRAISGGGGGRFFEAGSAEDIPRALLAEARSALRPWYEQTPFFPRVTSAGDLLAGISLDSFPQLGGYVATTAKPTGDVLLSGAQGDPVLATGQHGLGRTVAWTPDTAGRWTAGFLRSPVSAALMGRMVSWSLPTAGSEPVRIDAVPSGDGLEVTVAGTAAGGDLELRVVSPTGESSTEQLRPTGAGSWRGPIPAPETGTYLLRGVLRRLGSPVGQAELAVPVPYSPEYLDVGADDVLLSQLAAQGGAVLADAAGAWTQKLSSVSVTSPIFWMLLMAAALIWPVDVALRRLTLSPAKIFALVRVEATKRRRDAAAVPDAASRLRQGIEARRTRDNEPKGSADKPTTPGAQEKGSALATRLLEGRRAQSDQE